MAHDNERQSPAGAGPAGHQATDPAVDHWRQQAEAEVTGMAGVSHGDVDAWAGWFKNLEGPHKSAVRAVLQERFGNAYVAGIEQAVAREQQADERPLTHDEVTNIRMTYGESIDYSVVRIHWGGIYTDPGGQYARTIGNTMHMPITYRNDDGAINGIGLEHLYHEIGHVWQFQHAGWQYLPQALIAQLREGDGGEREGQEGAYQWRDYARNGTPLGRWNREAQAEMGARYNVCLHEILKAQDRGSRPLAEDLRDYILALPWALQLAHGQGATPDLTVAEVAKKTAVGPIGLLLD